MFFVFDPDPSFLKRQSGSGSGYEFFQITLAKITEFVFKKSYHIQLFCHDKKKNILVFRSESSSMNVFTYSHLVTVSLTRSVTKVLALFRRLATLTLSDFVPINLNSSP